MNLCMRKHKYLLLRRRARETKTRIGPQLWGRLAGVIRGCNIGHKDSLESPQTDVLYFLVKHVLYRKSL